MCRVQGHLFECFLRKKKQIPKVDTLDLKPLTSLSMKVRLLASGRHYPFLNHSRRSNSPRIPDIGLGQKLTTILFRARAVNICRNITLGSGRSIYDRVSHIGPLKVDGHLCV